jgi:hypothetical protein
VITGLLGFAVLDNDQTPQERSVRQYGDLFPPCAERSSCFTRDPAHDTRSIPTIARLLSSCNNFRDRRCKEAEPSRSDRSDSEVLEVPTAKPDRPSLPRQLPDPLGNHLPNRMLALDNVLDLLPQSTYGCPAPSNRGSDTSTQ